MPTVASKSLKFAMQVASLGCVAMLLGCGSVNRGTVAQPHPYAVAQPLEQPQRFAEGIISTEAIEYGPSFTPDGQTIYFTRRTSWGEHAAIYVSHFEQGVWQAPRVASFSGTHSDEFPFVTRDGRRIYFASKRPAEGSTAKTHNDIWYVERTAQGWGAPQHLPPPVNLDHIDSHPYVMDDGTLYFHSKRDGGAINMYLARLVEDRYVEPAPLPFNSEATDGELCVDPEGRFAIFYSDRPEAVGKGDLFIVYNHDGVWSDVHNLGDAINTADYEWTPAISPDGQYLFYAHLAGNDSDIYQIDLQSLIKDRLSD